MGKVRAAIRRAWNATMGRLSPEARGRVLVAALFGSCTLAWGTPAVQEIRFAMHRVEERLDLRARYAHSWAVVDVWSHFVFDWDGMRRRRERPWDIGERISV